MKGIKVLITTLERKNLDVMFDDGSVSPIYDEQCVAHMVKGYAGVSGRLGACLPMLLADPKTDMAIGCCIFGRE